MFTLVLAFLPAALAGSVLPSRLGGLSDRFGRRPPLTVALLVSGLAALAVPLVQSLWPLALLWVFEAAAFAAATPAEEALVVDHCGRRTAGYGVRVLHRRRRTGRSDRSAAGWLAIRPLRRGGSVRYQRATDGARRRADFAVCA